MADLYEKDEVLERIIRRQNSLIVRAAKRNTIRYYELDLNKKILYFILEKSFKRLSELHRNIFICHYFGYMSHKTISKKFNIKLNTVNSILYKTRKKIIVIYNHHKDEFIESIADLAIKEMNNE